MTTQLLTQALPPLPDPKYIWHEGEDLISSDLFVFADSGAVDEGCESCERLYTADHLREYAQAAIRAHLKAQPEPGAWSLVFPKDSRLCLSTVFDTEEEAKNYADSCSSQPRVVPLYAADPAPLANDYRCTVDRLHHVMHKHGLHPGRTDDDILEILDRHLSAPPQPAPQPLTNERALQAAYREGWTTAAEWAGRDDLNSDIGSPAYLRERQKALDGITAPKGAT